ncbi:hypothetical protein M422DRAFT_238405 [Sphaerobolus stellatus SS14]|nr:hypothetical protein M422DRAFT_238405 [Sphaerobolus stellatus SS14]
MQVADYGRLLAVYVFSLLLEAPALVYSMIRASEDTFQKDLEDESKVSTRSFMDLQTSVFMLAACLTVSATSLTAIFSCIYSKRCDAKVTGAISDAFTVLSLISYWACAITFLLEALDIAIIGFRRKDLNPNAVSDIALGNLPSMSTSEADRRIGEVDKGEICEERIERVDIINQA